MSSKNNNPISDIIEKQPEVSGGIAAGMAIGSAIPVVGTAVGGIVGGIAGFAFKMYRGKNKKTENSNIGSDIKTTLQDLTDCSEGMLQNAIKKSSDEKLILGYKKALDNGCGEKTMQIYLDEINRRGLKV